MNKTRRKKVVGYKVVENLKSKLIADKRLKLRRFKVRSGDQLV